MVKPAILTVDDDPAVLQAIRAICAIASARSIRSRGLVRSGRAQAARRVRDTRPASCPHRIRPADARDDRRRLPATGQGARPRRQARAAHRLRRHRRGDQGDQRHRARLLPAQALGPARGAALPGARGPAERVARRAPGDHERDPRGGPSLERSQPRDQDLPRPQPRPLPVARRRARRGGAPPARVGRRRHRRVADRPVPRSRAVDVALHARPGCRARSAHQRREAALRPVHRRRRTGRFGGRRLRRVRGPADDRRRARGARRAGRPERAIENYLGFPKGLSGADLTQRAVAQARRFGAEMVLARDVAGFESRGPVRAVRFDDGTEIEAHDGDRHRRLVSPPRGAGARRSRRARRLLRRQRG